MTKVKSRKELDASWQDWLRENLERKCDPRELRKTLEENGFDLESIEKHMGSAFPSLLEPPSRPDYRAIANVRLTFCGAQKFPSEKLQLYTLENFMSPDDCDRIVELSATSLRRSTVSTGDYAYRTSSTSDLSLMDHPDVESLDEKIARTLGVRLAYSEGIQAQRYEVGQEFRKHTDYFNPGTAEMREFAEKAGQRTWTFMVYLNEDMMGGGTKFWLIDKTFTPKKGMAVIWNNLHPDGSPNPATLHSGLPVESGHKIIITKWFRERGDGPMFF